MTALSDLLREANGQDWSSRAIAARAKERGRKIGHDTVAKYMRGDHGVPDEATLRAFAAAFPSLSMKKLRAAAGLPTEVTAIKLPEEASRLTSRQWEAVRELIRSMVNPNGEADSPSNPGDSGGPHPDSGADVIYLDEASYDPEGKGDE